MSTKTNILVNLVGSILPIGIAFISIPFLLESLGMEQFGILSLIWIMIGYLSIFDLGVGRALSYEVSNLYKTGIEVSDHGKVIGPGLILSAVAGLLGLALILPILVYMSSDIAQKFNVQPQSVDGLILCTLAILPTTITSGVRGALDGASRFIASNMIRALISCGMFFIPVAFVVFNNCDLTDITLGLVVFRYAVVFLAVYFLKDCLSLNCLKLKKTDFKIARYGFWVTISSIISPLMVNGDRFIVSSLVGPALLNLYTIPQDAIQRFLVLPGAYTTSIFPNIGKTNNVHYYYKQCRLNVILLSVVLVFLVAVFGPFFFKYWISYEFSEKTKEILYILCVGLFFNSIAQVPITFLLAYGKPKLVSISHSFELVVYAVAIYTLVKNFGIVGAAIAWAIRVILDFILLDFFVRKSE